MSRGEYSGSDYLGVSTGGGRVSQGILTMYGWQVSGTNPAGMLSCFTLLLEFGIFFF